MTQYFKRIEEAKENSLYKEFVEQRNLIFQDYPPVEKRTMEQIRECNKRVADLMFNNDSNFHKWLWEDFMLEEKIQIDRVMQMLDTKSKKPRLYEYRA